MNQRRHKNEGHSIELLWNGKWLTTLQCIAGLETETAPVCRNRSVSIPRSRSKVVEVPVSKNYGTIDKKEQRRIFALNIWEFKGRCGYEGID